MSIRQVQIKNMLDAVSQSHFIGGVNPQLNDLLKYMSQYFAEYPAGLPLRMERNLFESPRSDPELINDLMAKGIMNIDVLYETSLQQLNEITLLNTILRSHLERLRIKRTVLESLIDDYLLGIYNSDGYFFSISDQFTDTSLTDLDFTTSFIDVEAGTLSLPVIPNKSTEVRITRGIEPGITVSGKDKTDLFYEIKTPFTNAVDGLTNTAWFFEVRSPIPQTVTATISMDIATAFGSSRISKIDATPFGVTPVKVAIEAIFNQDVYSSVTQPFTTAIKTSTDKMSFIGDQINSDISSLIFTLVKTNYDYIKQDNGPTYIYTFGFKELAMNEHAYDQYATYVTKPLSLPAELGEDAVIDAVSLVTEETLPTSTTVKWYVTADVEGATSISDFSWREIVPIGDSIGQSPNKVISFDGSSRISKMVRRTRVSGADLLLIPFNNTSPDLAKRNPTPSIVPTSDIYRLVEFTDDSLAGSLLLEEGINTTKIYFTDLDEDAVVEGFAFWQDKFEDTESYFTTHGRIDIGHEFFYGGDVGESGKSIYVETYIELENDLPVLLKQCTKTDTNSQLWDMRVFLNGREIANMPVGVDKLTVPWKFLQGRNHVAALINIPHADELYPSPYIGTINLMTDSELSDFGTVKLNTWNYVDFYKFSNNQVNDPNSFTIYNKEIVSRRKPTDNYRLSYLKPTSAAPDSIRLRADLTRSSYYERATPLIDSYRIRFSYK